jgi:hypothetical protein
MGTPAVSNVCTAVVARDRTYILTGEGDSLDRARIWLASPSHRRYHHTMTYCADKHTCQMRLLMVGNRLPALSKSMSNAAALVSELQPYAILALPTES